MGKLHLTILTDHANICWYIWEVYNFCKQLYIYIYILSIHPKKKNFPAPFHSRAFVLLYKFETSWALLGRLSRVFFFLPFQEPLILNIRFSLPFLANYVSESFLESPILYLAFFKTILTASKPSFLHNHFTTQHSDFSRFLTVSTKDKLVNRSIHASSLFILSG